MSIIVTEKYETFGNNRKFLCFISRWKKEMTVDEITESVLNMGHNSSVGMYVKLIEEDDTNESGEAIYKSVIQFQSSGIDLIKVEIDTTNARYSKLLTQPQMKRFFENLENYYKTPEEFGFVIGSSV